MKRLLEQAKTWLCYEVDARVLSLFRIVYGLFMTYEMIDYIRIGLVRNMFFLPAINFKYEYLYWIKPLPESWMNILLYVMVGCTLMITFGVLFKWACRFFALSYAYIFLIDKGIYNNHIYLFILLAVLLSVTDADQWLSLRRRKPLTNMIPRWQPFIIQAQIIIVYFYGGIAKITYDWLVRGEPVRTLLNRMPADHILAPIYKNEFGVHTLTYVGFLIDIAAPLLLWYKPIRNWAVIPFIIFHFSNSRIFSDIGIFPYIMAIGLIIYFETQELPFLRKWFLKAPETLLDSNAAMVDAPAAKRHSAWIYGFLVAYFTFQLLFPFRGHFFPNDLDWTTIGNRFSWRMKVDTRQVDEMSFSVFDPARDTTYLVDIRTMINEMQMLNLSMDPRSIADFGGLLHNIAATKGGIVNPVVNARIRVRYNGRPSQYYIDPATDISLAPHHFYQRLDWVNPVLD